MVVSDTFTPAGYILIRKVYEFFKWLNTKISQKMASGGLLFLALLLPRCSMTCELPSVNQRSPIP